MTRPSRRRRAAGFTLIELMIGVALFGLVAIGMTTIVITMGRTRAALGRVDVAQSSLRSAVEFVTRDVQMASAGARTATIALATGATTVAPVVVTNSAVGPDTLDLVLVDATAQATLLAPFAGGQGVATVDTTAGFSVGDKAQLSDLSSAILLDVTGVAAGALSVTPPTNPLPVASFAPGALLFRSRRVTYAVDSTVFGAADPVLTLDPDGPGPKTADPLAEGVEDFQVALGFDNNGDGVITEVGKAANDDEWVYNVAGEAAPLSLSQLRSLRVTLVVRTTSPETATLGQRPTAEDHPGATAPDGYPRRTLRTEIAVRNFNL